MSTHPPLAPAAIQRHLGAVPADTLRAPLRRIALEVQAAPDGAIMLRWPQDACALHRGIASPEAPTTCQVANVTDWLPVWAAARPDTLFMAERDAAGRWVRVGYAEAWQGVQRISAALLERAAAGGDRAPVLAILSPNSIRQALLTFAALHVGIAVAPVSPAYATAASDPARLRRVMEVLEPDCVYSEDPAATHAALQALGVPAPARVDAGDVDRWLGSAPPPAGRIEAAHRRAQGQCVAKVMFTSGSTGVPKGVVMTHEMLAAAQATTAANLDMPPSQPQVYLEWLPWHHVMGGNINLHRLMRFGGSAYLDAGKPVPGKFEPTLANLREVAPTFYFNVPLGYAMLVPALERDEGLARHFLSRLEYLSFGGASLPASLVERIARLAREHAGRPVPVTSGYGATETSGPGLSTGWDIDSAGVLGLPSPGIVAKLVSLGDRYELRLAGANIAVSYLQDPAATAAATDEQGFYRTGDAVRWADARDPMKGLAFAGRVAEDFKLASGTWVNAGALRLAVVGALAPLVSDAVIAGHDRSHVTALLFIDERACRDAIADATPLPRDGLVRHAGLLREIGRRLAALNTRGGGSSVRVERALLMSEPPAAEAFEITEKGYLNQRAVLARRVADVERLYAESPAADIALAQP